MIEAVKASAKGSARSTTKDEYARFVERYGSMAHLQGMGVLPAEDPEA